MESFPNFSDGNVEIRFSEQDKFVLHSWTLALHSPWFKTSLCKRWNPNNNSNESHDKHYWIYEFRIDKDCNTGFLLKSQTDASASESTELPTTSSQPDADSDSCSDDDEKDDTPPPPELRASVAKGHQDVFRCLYHLSPVLHDGDDALFGEMQEPIRQLYEAAKFYQCEDLVRGKIDNKLRKAEKAIQYECKNDTVSMLEFAITIKSDWIFEEAAIHLAGQSNLDFEEVENKLKRLGIEEDMNELRKTLLKRMRDAELKMFCVSVNAGGSTWLAHAALNFFRHWLAEQIQTSQGSGMGPGYANLYHTVAKGLFSYRRTAHKQQVRDFMNKSHPGYTEADLDAMEAELRKVFKKAAKYVVPIREQCTRHQNSEEDNYRELTCLSWVEVKVPWEA